MNVLNGTVYETEDVMKLVQAVLDLGGGTEGLTVSHRNKISKIRYMNNKARKWDWNSRSESYKFASVTHPSWRNRDVEICILRPSKVELNALVALAEAADDGTEDYCAPSKVVYDTVDALYERLIDDWRLKHTERKAFRENAVAKIAKSLSLRINPKAKGRKAYTLANLEKRIAAKERNLKNQQGKLAKAKRAVAIIEKQLPTIEADIKKMRADLAAKQAVANG